MKKRKKYETTKKPQDYSRRHAVAVSKTTYDLIAEIARKYGLSRPQLVNAVFEHMKDKDLKINHIPAQIEVEIKGEIRQ